MAIDQNDKRGLQRPGTAESDFNELQYSIEQYLNNEIETAWIGRVDGCSTEGNGPTGTADVTPMTAQSDAEGQALPMVSVPALPHTRLQAGKVGIIINPVPGDRVVCVSCKGDISTINRGTDSPQRPGSFRTFDQSDSVIVGTLHTEEPTTYIQLEQDETIYIKAPNKITIETDAEVIIKSAGEVTIDAPKVKITGTLEVGSITSSGGVSIDTSTVSMTGDLNVTGNINAGGHIHGN